MPKLYRIPSAPVGTIRIDRTSPWGNPFVMTREADRAKVCQQFEQYAHWRLTIEPDWLAPLIGKDLACWCAPKQCHGETLLQLAQAMRGR